MIDFKNLSVLIVEDQQHQQNQLEECLFRLGINNIRHCENGNIALYWLRSKLQYFDLVITDWCMPIYSRRTVEKIQKQVYRDPELRQLPISNGLDLCQAIRRDTQLQHIKIVLRSACLAMDKQQSFLTNDWVDAVIDYELDKDSLDVFLKKLLI